MLFFVRFVCIWVSECDEENICDDVEENVRYDWDSDEQVEKRKKKDREPWCLLSMLMKVAWT